MPAGKLSKTILDRIGRLKRTLHKKHPTFMSVKDRLVSLAESAREQKCTLEPRTLFLLGDILHYDYACTAVQNVFVCGRVNVCYVCVCGCARVLLFM